MEDPLIFSGLLLAAICLLSLFFSANNYALRSYSKVRLQDALGKERARARLDTLSRYEEDLVLMSSALRTFFNLVAILLVVWLIQVSSSVSDADGVVQQVHLSVWNYVTAFAVTAVLLSAFSVAIPNAWSRHAPEKLLGWSLPLLAATRWLLVPVIAFMQLFDGLVRRLAGVPQTNGEYEANEVEQEILNVVKEGEQAGYVDEEEKEMLESVIEFRNSSVDQIMTPRTEMVAVGVEASLDEVKQVIAEAGHSRIPVYRDSLDNVVGLLYAKDLLHNVGDDKPFDLESIMRTPLFVPETKSVPELLRELREQKVHIAIVLDEYGGTAGLVTIEDILEELVGEIADEYEQPEEPRIHRVDDQTVEVDTSLHVDEFNDALELEVPENGDYETLGGFVVARLGRIPQQGETFNEGRLTITVLDATERKVNRVRVEVGPEVDDQEQQ